MDRRSVVCAGFFTVAYILLIPGLTCLLFSAKASFLGVTVVDLEKSTFGAIHLLTQKGRWLAALTILLCSVVAPFLKLAVLLVCVYCTQVRGYAGPGVSSAITVVRRISKWATVDAFTASIFVAFFCNNPMLQVSLHKGFYCFLGYCIFSVAGALLLEKPDQALTEEQQGLVSPAGSSKKSMLPALGVSIALLGLLVALLVVPLFSVECTILGIKENLSFAVMIERLGKHGSVIAAQVCMTLVFLLPAADLIFAAVQATTGRVGHTAGEWLQDFAMLDVFALSILVVSSAATGLHQSLTVELLHGGRALVACACLWLVYSLAFRARTGAHAQTRKEKRAAGALESAIDSEKQT